MEIHRAEPFNNALLLSLSTFRRQKHNSICYCEQLDASPPGLANQLCDVLLGKIRAISLQSDNADEVPRHDMSALRGCRRNRSGRHLAVPQGNPANHSKTTEIVPAACDEHKYAAAKLLAIRRRCSR